MVAVILHSAAFKGAVAGFASAFSVDLHAFTKFNGWKDFGSYDFGVATFRWFTGIVTGALTGAGYGALIG